MVLLNFLDKNRLLLKEKMKDEGNCYQHCSELLILYVIDTYLFYQCMYFLNSFFI